jgi:hypothetical protein
MSAVPPDVQTPTALPFGAVNVIVLGTTLKTVGEPAAAMSPPPQAVSTAKGANSQTIF